MLRVIVVSALPAVRAGLRTLLEQSGDLTVIGEAAHLRPQPAPDSPAPADGMLPDVIVLDGPSAAEGAEELADALSGPLAEAGLVFLGPLYRPLPVLPGQGWAYLGREASGEQIVAAVHAVARGLVAIDPRAGGHLLSALASDAADGEVLGAAAGGAVEELTAREREVLQLVALGLPNKHIARRLAISEHTVKFHVAAVLAKLGAGSRTEAVHLAARRGLVAL